MPERTARRSPDRHRGSPRISAAYSALIAAAHARDLPAADLRETPLEERPLGLVRGELAGPGVGRAASSRPPETPQQVGPRRVEVRVVVELAASRRSRRRSRGRAPARRPSRRRPPGSARRPATARSARATPYSAAICAQSVSSAVAASSWSAAIAAWSWYGPTRRIRSARSSELPALVDPGPVPARAVLVLEQDELAVRARPRLPPRVVEQHEREQAEGLRLVGHERRQDAGQADRLARTARAGSARSPAVAP